MTWFQILVLIVALSGLTFLGAISHYLVTIVNQLAQINDWRRGAANEKMQQEISRIESEAINTVQQLRLIESELGGLRSDVRAMWSPEVVARSLRKGYLGS